MILLDFNKCNEFNINIYKDEKLYERFNWINKLTTNMLDVLLNKSYSNYFGVPYIEKNTIWGKEIIFLPFTTKLFKILITSKNDTSLQLHYKKTEIWYPIKNSIISDGKKNIYVDKNDKIIINNGVIHCLKKGGCIFEVQDNLLFDNDVIRIYDVNKRNIVDNYEYLKYISPLSKMVIEKNDYCFQSLKNIFVFVLNHDVVIQEKIHLKKYNLYYFKEVSLELFGDLGNYIFTESDFIVEEFFNYGIS